MADGNVPEIAMDWRSLVLLREIYGHVHTLLMRDMSSGNDLAVAGALGELADLTRMLKSNQPEGLPAELVPFFEEVVRRHQVYRPEKTSWPLMSRLKTQLERLQPRRDGFDVSHVQEPKLNGTLSHVVIAVGSNIGVGDEFLAAKAIGSRIMSLKGPLLHVSTRRPDIWRLVARDDAFLPPPPFGAYEALAAAGKNERRTAGLVFLDFVDSDPFPDYTGPGGLAFACKWIMGERRAEWQIPGEPGRIMVTPPAGAPRHRETELAYLAGRVIPGSLAAPPVLAAAPSKRRKSHLVLQCLTSKKSLMLPPEFWADVISGAALLTKMQFKVAVAPGPTPTTASHVQRQCAALNRVLGPGSAASMPRPAFPEIFDAVSKSAAVIGPDTFTSHFAAFAGTPQISIIQPQHIAWVPSLSAVFFVESDAGDYRDLTRVLSRRLAVAAGLPGSAQALEVLEDARIWRDTLKQAWTAAHLFAVARVPFPDALKHWKDRLHEIYFRRIAWTEALMECRYEPRYPACLSFDPADFSNPEDLGWAAIRWLQALTLNEINGALQVAAAPD